MMCLCKGSDYELCISRIFSSGKLGSILQISKMSAWLSLVAWANNFLLLGLVIGLNFGLE